MPTLRRFLACLIAINSVWLWAAIYQTPAISEACLNAMRGLVEPNLVQPNFRQLPDSTAGVLAIVRSEFDSLGNAAQVLGTNLSNSNNECQACAVRVQHVLTQAGIMANKVNVNHSMDLKVNGVPKLNVSLHDFVVIAAIGLREEVIIDSSYLQFLRKGSRTGNPTVFVGTRSELIEFFRKNQSAIKRSANFQSIPEEIDPAEFVEHTYGFGRGHRVVERRGEKKEK